jgi:sortase A
MSQQQKPIPRQTLLLIEQLALLFTSFIWTTVILSVIIMFWAIQDMQSNWNVILGIPPTPTPEPELAFIIEPTPTPWQGPPPTPTPTETLIPTETPTLVIKPPEILPDTPNQGEPTLIPVMTHPEEEAAVLPTNTPTPLPPITTPTPTPAPTEGISPPPAQPGAPTTSPTPTPEPTPTSPPPPPAQKGPTRLVISSVGIDSPIVPVGWQLVEQNGQQFSVWQVANHAVGWHETSALPGYPGNTVMAGHHNMNGEVFRDLVNVEVGDEVVIYVDNTAYNYKIEVKTIVKEKGESLEVRRKNAEWIAPTTDERITMVTCWPYSNNTHRVIVVAKPG